ncbi:MAG: PQQ-binding-like beta-propeller repeat protein [Chloroflexi bacterium]|nr:PQQ-binding-like beta-propeller repeat protein [Chloroflexota bacterium]
MSSPVLVGDPSETAEQAFIVIGSDDGGARALDPRTGEQRWLYSAGRAIEAPIVAADATVYVASRDGTLAALDAATGEVSWTIGVSGPNEILRTQPAIGAKRLFIVDGGGAVTALDRQAGRRLWTTAERSYVGPPIVLDETLLVAGKDGEIWRLSALDGAPQGRWAAAEVSSPTDPAPSFVLGPTLGGGAIWLIDDGGVVRRLGASSGFAASTPLRAAWVLQASDPLLGRNFVFRTAADYDGTAVLVDLARNFYLIDPATGRGARGGTIGAPAGAADGPEQRLGTPDPVVAEGTLLAVVGNQLHAMRLPDGAALWQFGGQGLALHPPTAAGDHVLWLTLTQAAGGPPTGVLYALDLADGSLRWEAPVGAASFAGGAVIHADRVYVSTPPAALELASGRPTWQAALAEVTLGAPTLSPAGDTLFVGTSSRSGGGAVVALGSADGRLRWQAELGADSIHFAERL